MSDLSDIYLCYYLPVNKREGKTMTGKIKFLLSISAVLVIATVLSFSIKAYANDKKGREYRESVSANENIYEKEVRDCLNDYGFKNAGINLTKQYDEERNVTYSLMVNHHSFEYASNEKIDEIEDRMYEMADEYLKANLETSFTF